MKHQWKRDKHDPEEIDIFAYEGSYHNGPECVACGRSTCHHCVPSLYDEECPAAPVLPDAADR